MKFEPEISMHALAADVLAVATTRVEGAWCAYIAAVAGIRHDEEYQAVLRTGEKLPERIAKVLFPGCDLPYAS